MGKQRIIIERIELSNPRKLLYTVFYNDGNQRNIRQETLLHFGLAQGSTISPDLEKKIQRFEQEIGCKEQAYRYLARRPHLERELINKLRTKGYSLDLISRIIHYLKDKNLLNDTDFIYRFAEEEKKLKHSGPLLIKKKLLSRGASSQIVDEWLKQFYPENEQMHHAGILAEKKYHLLRNYPQKKRMQKLQSFLKQKGYNWYIIKETVVEWMGNEEDES